MANKYRTGLVKEYNQKKQEEAEEQRKREKYNITDENVKVVEKSNTVKFLVRLLILAVKTAAWIALIILAAVGVICLIYPETRNALITVLTGIKDGTIGLLH